jgi:hypothetical protein
MVGSYIFLWWLFSQKIRVFIAGDGLAEPQDARRFFQRTRRDFGILLTESVEFSVTEVGIFQWIGLRENLQETMVFTIKYRGFL